jgi:hypothetical protein
MEHKLVYFLLLLLLVTSGCKHGEQQKEPARDLESLGFGNADTAVLKDVYYRFPSPEEMLNVINNEELQYQSDLLAPLNDAESYVDTRSQALNMGVYIADLAYITLFQQHKESMKFFQAIYELSVQLRIASAFEASLMLRIENDLKNVDSLEVLADVAYSRITNFLVRNDKERIFAVISIGGFIESLYLSSYLVEDFEPDNAIIQRIADQKYVLDNLLLYAGEFSNDDVVRASIKMVQPVVELFESLERKKGKTKVSKAEDGVIMVSGGSKLEITQEQFEELKTRVSALRYNIIQQQF